MKHIQEFLGVVRKSFDGLASDDALAARKQEMAAYGRAVSELSDAVDRVGVQVVEGLRANAQGQEVVKRHIAA